jgi:hypothetical protein
MASVAVANPAVAPALTAEEIAYNAAVDKLANDLKTIASDISEDMKLRQLPVGLKGDKVYGKSAANRSQLKTLASHIKKVGEKVVPKLKKGVTKKSKGDFIGFAVPSYINRDMALALGLRESQPGQAVNYLWPQGGKPIFSAALITKFFSHYVMANGLIHQDDLSKFNCSDTMRALFSPFVVSSVEPGEPPIDLNNLTFTSIQKLTKNFVERRTKVTPGPHLDAEKGTDAEREQAKNLIAVFKMLEAQFKDLGELKKEVEQAIVAEARAKNDVVKAQACQQAGQITVELFNSYAHSYTEIAQRKEQLFQTYRAKAKQMGI